MKAQIALQAKLLSSVLQISAHNQCQVLITQSLPLKLSLSFFLKRLSKAEVFKARSWYSQLFEEQK